MGEGSEMRERAKGESEGIQGYKMKVGCCRVKNEGEARR